MIGTACGRYLGGDKDLHYVRFADKAPVREILDAQDCLDN